LHGVKLWLHAAFFDDRRDLLVLHMFVNANRVFKNYKTYKHLPVSGEIVQYLSMAGRGDSSQSEKFTLN